MKSTIQRLMVAGVVVSALATPTAQAPAGDADHPAFDSASVKPNKSGDGRVALRGQPGGVFTAINMTTVGLIQFAYRVQPFQIVGGPDWIKTDRFDVNAKAGANVPPGQGQLMMQALLADRFKLAVHKDSREAPVYALVMARNGGKPGPQLKVSECAPPTPGPQAPQAAPQNGPGPCGTARIGFGAFLGQGVPMAQILTFLSNLTNRTVIDRTGLTGTFDVDLKWAPDSALGTGPFGGLPPAPPGAAPPPQPSDAPELFTAIQEQLGLKLESQRGPVDVLVIDRVEQPTAD